jgi:hypothetical protein
MKIFIKDVSGDGRSQYNAAGMPPDWEKHKQEILDESRDGLRDREYLDPPDDAPDLDANKSDLENLAANLRPGPQTK